MRRGILATRDELTSLRKRIRQKPFDAIYDSLVRRCALILESAPVTEMQWQSAWASGRQNAALTAARGAQGRILDLVIADAIDPNGAYRSRAIEELINLVGWSTWVDPCRADLKVNLCTAEAAVAAVVGLDWLWDFLTDEQRRIVLNAINRRVIGPYLQSVKDDVWWYSAVNHWGAVINSACGLAGLALGEENPAAEQTLTLARKGLKHFFDDLGKEGGWDEGIGYWGYAIRSVLLLSEGVSRVLDDQKLFHQRGMDKTGLFPIYFTPNGRPASFGDSAQAPLHGTLHLLGRYFDRSEITWWLDTYSLHHDPSTMDWSQAGMALLFRAEHNGVVEPKLEPVKVFQQVGWAAMADHWPRPSFYAAVKTGDLATSHAQRDMNSLQLQVNGEMLLVDIGHPPDEGSEYFSPARNRFYEVQAPAHNTITVAREDHRPDAQGAILDSGSDKTARWIVADAGTALGESNRFHRAVVILTDENGEGETLVVLDELQLASPEKVHLFWHTGGKIELDEANHTGRMQGRKANLHFAVTAAVPIQSQTGSHKLSYGYVDHFLRISAGVTGTTHLLSVFSRNEIPAAPTLEADPKGALKVQVGDKTLNFQTGKKGLQYQPKK
ncbi:MAG: heparinase II/III family protein [Phycisphaerae bacterium]|nr:heparinase II/III family protein [Phycisphaerae bacterium]